MATGATTDGFLDLVRKSGGVDVRRLEAFLGQNASQLPDDPAGLADALVGAGLMTRFQADPLLKGQPRRFIISGKYRLLDRLGAGGMASVFLCEHRIMRRRVAIKVLPGNQSSNPAALDRFHREARACAALDHPNIVRAHDVDADGKMHFLVVEYVEGTSFYDLIRRHGPVSVAHGCHYIRQSALGLQHAHEKGLVHRDIKPANLLLDRTGTVKVLDLGLALFFHDDDNITKEHDSGAILGTADYLAPEQAINSHSVDIRADIYSLGITFYFLLTARTPYGEGTTAQKLVWHHLRPATPIRQVRPDVPEEVEAVIMKMLAKDPNDRYQTPGQVADALAPFTTEPLPPPPEEWMPKPLVPLASDSPTSEIAPAPALAAALPTPLDFASGGTGRAERPQPTPRPAASRPAGSPKSSTVVGRPGGPPKSSPAVAAAERPTPSPSAAQTAVAKKRPAAAAAEVVEAEVVEAEVVEKKKKKKKKAEAGSNAVMIAVAGACALVASLAAVVVVYSSMPAKPKDDTKQQPQQQTKADPPKQTVKPVTPPSPPKKAEPKPPPKKDEPKKVEPPKVEPKKVEPPPPPPPAPTLTADYFPILPGNKLLYDTADLIQTPQGPVWRVLRQQWEFTDKDSLEITNLKGGISQTSILAGGKPVLGPVKLQKQTVSLRVTPKGIEAGTRDKKDKTKTNWELLIQVGAKPGDTWKVIEPGGDIRTLTLVKFDKFNDKPAAFIEDKQPIGGGAEATTTHIYVQGIGEVQKTVSSFVGGKAVVVKEVKLATD